MRNSIIQLEIQSLGRIYKGTDFTDHQSWSKKLMCNACAFARQGPKAVAHVVYWRVDKLSFSLLRFSSRPRKTEGAAQEYQLGSCIFIGLYTLHMYVWTHFTPVCGFTLLGLQKDETMKRVLVLRIAYIDRLYSSSRKCDGLWNRLTLLVCK